MSARQRLAAFVAVFVLALSGLALVDTLTAPPSAAPHAQPSSSELPTGRAFVLLIDSLRYETAVSAELMPELHALRAQSTFARVTPTRDAVTVPCLRAAFTGRDRTRVFGFVENFLKGNAGLESIFTALAQRARSAAVYSDGAFDQFGDQGIARRGNGEGTEHLRDHVAEQNAMLPVALAEYLRGEQDLVVLHLTYTDHVAHESGVGAPPYKERFRAADALVARLHRELPESDTLVVMGDHGHDAAGRHAVGLDVPTYALYRGPRFAEGVVLGTVAIRDHRYLLGFALGLPLPGDYTGARHVRALRAGSAAPGAYAAAPSGAAVEELGVPQRALAGYLLGGVVLVALFGLWVWRDSQHGLLRVGEALLAALGAPVVWALAALFPQLRPFIHEPGYLMLGAGWLLLWAAALVVCWRTRRLELGALVLGLPLYLEVPTVYRYGAPAAMAPAWLGLLSCLAFLFYEPRRLHLALLAAGLLLPFGFSDAIGFRFEEWVLWPPSALPSGFLLSSLIAKGIVLVPRERSALSLGVGLSCAALVSAAQLGWLPYAWQLSAASLSLALAARRRHRLSTTFAVAGLLLLHHYAVRVPTDAYYWQDCLLAALVLSARIVAPLPSPARRYAHAALLVLAFFASGWVSFAWTLHRLEWGFLYDFWSAAFVEAHVVWFLPLLMGRFALPLIAARALLRRELPEADSGGAALALAWVMLGSKVVSLMFWSYGSAFVSVASDVYLEAVQETALACVLLLGML